MREGSKESTSIPKLHCGEVTPSAKLSLSETSGWRNQFPQGGGQLSREAVTTTVPAPVMVSVDPVTVTVPDTA